jgi:transcriptional regulator with XRE-family HTH domain
MDVSTEAQQLGDLLRQNRVIRNYTQEDLAFSVGVSRDTIARLENNPGSVEVENLLAELKKFGLEKETLWAINPLSRNTPPNATEPQTICTSARYGYAQPVRTDC